MNKFKYTFLFFSFFVITITSLPALRLDTITIQRQGDPLQLFYNLCEKGHNCTLLSDKEIETLQNELKEIISLSKEVVSTSRKSKIDEVEELFKKDAVRNLPIILAHIVNTFMVINFEKLNILNKTEENYSAYDYLLNFCTNLKSWLKALKSPKLLSTEELTEVLNFSESIKTRIKEEKIMEYITIPVLKQEMTPLFNSFLQTSNNKTSSKPPIQTQDINEDAILFGAIAARFIIHICSQELLSATEIQQSKSSQDLASACENQIIAEEKNLSPEAIKLKHKKFIDLLLKDIQFDFLKILFLPTSEAAVYMRELGNNILSNLVDLLIIQKHSSIKLN